MSKNNSNQGTPAWAKAAALGAGVIGILAIGYYAVTNVFGAGVNAYKDMFNKQFDALVKKISGYVQTNPTGFTPAQQQTIAEEEKILNLTQQGLANASNGLYNTLEVVAAIVVGGLVAVGVAVKFISARFRQTGQKAVTGYGASYIAITSMADSLSAQGYVTQATNMISAASTMFRTIDQPAMQQSVTSLQTQLNILQGTELLVAQQMISQLSIEMSIIPTMLRSLPPVPI